jgi:ribose transport system substrate-binding protein
MMKRFMGVTVWMLSMCMLTGCGGEKSDSTPGDEPTASKVIGITLMTTSNPFFVTLGEAAKEEARKHGFEVSILSGENAERQANQITDFISQGVDAIIIAPNDHFAVGDAIKKANAANIPVFTADTGCTDKSAVVTSNVMTDNHGGGVMAGEAMIRALDGKGGKVLILSFDDAQSCLLRVVGFRERIDAYNAEHPNALINIVAELPGKAAQDPSKLATEDQIVVHSDLAGIFAINDPSALGAVVAVENAQKSEQIKIVGFDGQRIGKEAIRDGKIFADPIQFPKQIGAITVQQIVKYLNGDEPEAEILIPTKLYFQADALSDPELQ